MKTKPYKRVRNLNETRIWLIIAASLVLVGFILFTGVIVVTDWSFSDVFNPKFETNFYEINESYNNISVLTDTGDIKIEISK